MRRSTVLSLPLKLVLPAVIFTSLRTSRFVIGLWPQFIKTFISLLTRSHIRNTSLSCNLLMDPIKLDCLSLANLSSLVLYDISLLGPFLKLKRK
jgi:hypothetical protein